MKLRVRLVLAFLLCTLVANAPVQSQGSAQQPAATPSDPNTPDNLKLQIEQIMKALKSKQQDQLRARVADLRMPDEKAWFSQTFGAEMGEKMARRYADAWPSLAAVLERDFKTAHDDKRTEIAVHQTTERNLLGFPQIVSAMKSPEILYSVGASKHGKKEWNLPGVYAVQQGSYRCIPESLFAIVPGIKPGRVRLGGDVMQPKVITSVPPVYPPDAKAARVTGTVVLHAVIGVDGSVLEVSYISGPAPLARSAEDAVRQWRYEVTRLNDVPIEVDTTVSVHYVLH